MTAPNPDNRILCLVSNCIPVKGSRRSLIADLDRNEFRLIPNSLYELLIQYNKHTVSEIRNAFPDSEQVTLTDYFSFLEQHEYIFRVDTIDEAALFPPLNLKWDYPCIISNAIVDIGIYSKHPYESIFIQLQELGCKDIQIRCYHPLPLPELEVILHYLDESRFKSIDLIFPYTSANDPGSFLALACKFPRIRSAFIYASPVEEVLYAGEDTNTGVFYFTTQLVPDEHRCGVVDARYFTVNTQLFTEAKKYNTCLNRKLSIDQYGEIRNCPSMEASFGHCSDTRLADAVEYPGFKDYWQISKDRIRTCSDCEFRYICVDCRAYLETPSDTFSKPLKCGYNPYTAEWEDWSTHPLKEKARLHYGFSADPAESQV
ncbi:MAG: grasp-with-spasm system SPASM domain peptide maturase [Bacteroidia bacterium]